jgi:modulator of FtsH protease
MQMNNYSGYKVIGSNVGVVATNQVLRNTYFLLSLTLIFSALTAYLAMAAHVAYVSPILTIVGMFGLLFLTQMLRNSKLGLLAIFAFTGFMGYTLAPILNLYLHTYTNGASLVMTALGGTGAIFLSLSAYALITRKDFSYMGGFLFVAITVAFLASLAGLFLNIPLLQVLVSSAFILICSALILFHTSQLIYGGETNYIMATISLYVALFNLFISLLNVLSFFGGRRD